jgi:hypothetical protein
MKMRGASVLVSVAILLQVVQAQTNRYYPSGRAPLLATAYVKLPFGAVRPQGWLNTQLNLQANAMTGHVDEFYSPLSTLAGTNRTIEYLYCFYEGQMALAYLMNNSTLITKARANVDYIINSQTADGNFLGTTESFDHIALCRGLVEYYEITNDSRVIPFLTNYFHYVNTSGLTGNMWSMNRTPEHLIVAYWLFNRTGDQIVLNAIQSRCLSQINNWRNNYNNYTFTDSVNPTTNYNLYCHNVNIGHAFKYALYHLQSNDASYRTSLYTNALTLVDRWHGDVAGRFNADENYTGKQPTRGMETCGIAEMSFSMEKLFEAYGDVTTADRAEFLVYNCWTGCNTADMWGHQYDQQSNQIKVSNETRPWNTNGTTSNLFGREPNWPCCLCNVHHTWPRYVEHMWMATQDNGLLASLYGPCQVTALVGPDTATVTITESTEYPFDGRIGFKITLSKTDSFPISFRIPQWESSASVQIGTSTATPAAGTVYTLRRRWQTGDSVTVTFPMRIRSEYRWNHSISVMRGPLWYSLKIGGTWAQQSSSSNYMGSKDWAITSNTAWNIGLKIDPANPNGSFTVVRNAISTAPFAQRGEQVYLPGSGAFTTWMQDPPVILRGQGRILTGWTVNSTYPGNANDPPTSPLASTVAGRDTSIELIPYGSAKLRVTQFPWISTPVAVLSRDNRIPKESELMVTAAKNGNCLFTVKPAGYFDLMLLDIAGRVVYNINGEGPISFVLERGTLHKGTYVAHIASAGRKFEKKILIVQ